MPGYKLVRADSLSNNKRSGASTGCQYYFKETFAVRPVPINNLKECLLLEVFIIIIIIIIIIIVIIIIIIIIIII